MYGQSNTEENRKKIDKPSKRGIHPVLEEKWKQTLYTYPGDSEYEGQYSKRGLHIVMERMLADSKHLTEEKRKDVSRFAEEIMSYLGNKDVLTEDEFTNEMQKNVDNNTMKDLVTKARRRMFYCMDLDSDEEISLEEFKLFYKAIKKEGTLDAEKAFTYIDANKNGVITMKEYIDAFIKYFCDESVSVYDLPLFGTPSVD